MLRPEEKKIGESFLEAREHCCAVKNQKFGSLRVYRRRAQPGSKGRRTTAVLWAEI